MRQVILICILAISTATAVQARFAAMELILLMILLIQVTTMAIRNLVIITVLAMGVLHSTQLSGGCGCFMFSSLFAALVFADAFL